MGCDIHIYVEAKKIKFPKTVATWHNIDNWHVDDSYSPVSAIMEGQNIYFDVDYICDTRDYQLFSILAGIRDEGIVAPISPQKGLPADVSMIVKAMEATFEGFAHSHSYFTLQELKESIYFKQTTIKAWIHKEDVQLIKNGKADHLYYHNFEVDDYVYSEWIDNPNLSFLSIVEILEKKKIEQRIIDDSDIRIVFWFDS